MPSERASDAATAGLTAPVTLGSSKRHRLRGEAAFAALFKTGRRVNGEHLQLLAAPAERSIGRVGYIIGKKQIASAVKRNYLRRLLREAVQERRPAMDAFDIVLRLRVPCSPLKLSGLRGEATELLGTLTRAC